MKIAKPAGGAGGADPDGRACDRRVVAGAVAGNLIGKGQAGGDACDRVLERNP